MLKKLFIILLLIQFIFAKIQIKPTKHLLLSNFACEIVQSEHDTNPDIRNVVLLIGENFFGFDFTKNVLRCLPKELAQTTLELLRLNKSQRRSFKIKFPKLTMVLVVADVVDEVIHDLEVWWTLNIV